jgi:CspA family cold shock protein
MVFKDQIVRCAACGTDFVYTVREQRQRAELGLSLDRPTFCPDCRGADARLAEAELSRPTAEAGSSPASPVRRPAAATESRPNQRPNGRDGRGSGGRGRRPSQDGGNRRPKRQPARQTELRFRYLGVVKWFDEGKGYGFIAADDDGSELFVHASGILAGGVTSLVEGQPVEYEVEHTPRGLQAVDVVPLD